MEVQIGGMTFDRRNERQCPQCGSTIFDYYHGDGSFAFTSICNCEFFKKRDEYAQQASQKLLRQRIEEFKELSHLSDDDIESLKKPYQKTAYNIKAYDKCKAYIDGFDSNTEKGFLFIGNPGTGKSYLCKKIAYAVLKKFKSVLFITANDIVENQKQRIQDKELINMKDYAFDVDLLILDDLGAESNSEYNASIIFDVVNRRLEQRKPTLYTSNLTIQELKDYDGKGRIYDRILASVIDVYSFTGESFRKKKFEEEREVIL